MTCSSCKYLNDKNKKDGAYSSCCYYCSKQKQYINGSNPKCPEFERTYARTTYEYNKIYEEGEHYSADATPLEVYLILLIALFIMVIIVNIF